MLLNFYQNIFNADVNINDEIPQKVIKKAVVSASSREICKSLRNCLWSSFGDLPLALFFQIFTFDPPESIRKPKVFWCFQGDQKGTLESKS